MVQNSELWKLRGSRWVVPMPGWAGRIVTGARGPIKKSARGAQGMRKYMPERWAALIESLIRVLIALQNMNNFKILKVTR